MKEKKIILIALAIIMLVIIGANTAFATNVPIVIQPSNNTAQETNNVDNNTATNNVVGNNTTNNTTTNIISGTNNTSRYNNTNTTNLPKTGANDYAIFAIIAVCAVSAIYAYKKIRDYNV